MFGCCFTYVAIIASQVSYRFPAFVWLVPICYGFPNRSDNRIGKTIGLMIHRGNVFIHMRSRQPRWQLLWIRIRCRNALRCRGCFCFAFYQKFFARIGKNPNHSRSLPFPIRFFSHNLKGLGLVIQNQGPESHFEVSLSRSKGSLVAMSVVVSNEIE